MGAGHSAVGVLEKDGGEGIESSVTAHYERV